MSIFNIILGVLVSSTGKNHKDILETANKLIFVKEYRNALNLLEELLTQKECKNDCLIHQRRIELGCRLGEAASLLELYQEQLRRSSLDPKTASLCIAMVEQYGQLASTSASIKSYSEIILKYGECAAAYYGIALALESEANNERALFNYQQCVKVDVNWYPAYFGMSQIYYKRGDHTQGNQYFFLFEQHEPYTLYGNIETHRKLSEEFLSNGQFKEAEIAIHSLVEWWMDNRQFCPREIRVVEALCLANIEEAKKGKKSALHLETVRTLVDAIIEDKETKVEDLHALAAILQDFHQTELCVKVFKQALMRSSQDPMKVQKIGMQLLSIGELQHALELFETANQANPDHIAVRFCLLSTRLKIAKVDIELYFYKKELAKKLFDSKEDIESLAVALKDLLSMYKGDSDIHKMLGDMYSNQGEMALARVHYSKMYDLEPKNKYIAIHYASFLVNYDDLVLGFSVLNEIEQRSHDEETEAMIHSLNSRYFERKKEYENAIREIGLALNITPWNADFLVQIIRCQMLFHFGEKIPKEAQTETRTDYTQLEPNNWVDFDKMTDKLEEDHQNFLVYNRCKLRLLTSGGKEPNSTEWIRQAVKYNPSKAALEFLKLLNTNFDSPQLYWALGVLFREAGSLEIAEMWFEQVLSKNSLPNELRLKVSLDVSDCYIWRGVHLQKALAYLKMVRDSDTEHSELARLKMAHSYLKLGEVRLARDCLNALDIQKPSLESTYLQGLLYYRDGSVQKAKALWKPLLTVKTMSIRDHWIKKEILDFYFQGKSYIKNE